MDLSNLKPHTQRLSRKRVGRGGKRGTTSGHGTKGQKGRAGASVKPGFRGGDNRLWQLFPKQRGAGKKHGSKRPHRKHRFFLYRQGAVFSVNVSALNVFPDGATITGQTLFEKGLIAGARTLVKILGDGVLKRKLTLQGIPASKSAIEKISKAGGSVQNLENTK